MGMQGLDRHITGNWGEDSVAPEFIKASELGDYEMHEIDGSVVIDAAPESAEQAVPVTVTDVRITSGMVYVTTEELAWPLVLPEDAAVCFADKEN
ncbi:hypothetical protein GCM10010331_44250 [Streptomyces xanthochromogenes]|uniref:hypothetical protein n=1 Tax=Streptomyces xanthochromogenes TaxID=67384 RepID=UPI00167316F4|nr:hypothetical protein [Streptomyces xanthochromogenes]GHB51859.1 hypothetical protein GCM10010331_44250 [Streptomyces xanthochromogenes]